MKYCLITLLLLTATPCFAATTEEVESLFQNGLKLSQEGKSVEAMEIFNRLVATDHTDLDPNYYQQTYSEAYFYLGYLESQQDHLPEGIDAFLKAVEIFPQHARALYYLAFDYLSLGEIEKARDYYNRALALGYKDDGRGDAVGEVLASAPEKTINVSGPDAGSKIEISGTLVGDEQLMTDAARAVGMLHATSGKPTFTHARVDLVRLRENNEVALERWDVGEGTDTSRYWVTYDFTPPPDFPSKVAIQVSKEEGIK